MDPLNLNVTSKNLEEVIQQLVADVDDLESAQAGLGGDLRDMTKFLGEHRHNDDIYHNGETVLQHIQWVLDDLEWLIQDKDEQTQQLLRLLAVLHDLGKAYTHTVSPEGKQQFHKHNHKSVEIAEVLLAKHREALGETYHDLIELIEAHDVFLVLVNEKARQPLGSTKYLSRFMRKSIYTRNLLNEMVTFAKADSYRSKRYQEGVKDIAGIIDDIAALEKKQREEAVAKAYQKQRLQQMLPEIRQLLEAEAPYAVSALPDLSEVNRLLGEQQQYYLIKQIKRLAF
jgi:putative nucleotidyltransferase with HDIG domain